MTERTKIIVGGIVKPLLWGVSAILLLIVIPIVLIFTPGHYAPKQSANHISEILILHISDASDLDQIDEGEFHSCRQLDASEQEDFIRALSSLTYRASTGEPIFHPGAAVCIYYADGSCELISADCRCYYLSPTSRKYSSYYFDAEAFTELLITYGYEVKN